MQGLSALPAQNSDDIILAKPQIRVKANIYTEHWHEE